MDIWDAFSNSSTYSFDNFYPFGMAYSIINEDGNLTNQTLMQSRPYFDIFFLSFPILLEGLPEYTFKVPILFYLWDIRRASIFWRLQEVRWHLVLNQKFFFQCITNELTFLFFFKKKELTKLISAMLIFLGWYHQPSLSCLRDRKACKIVNKNWSNTRNKY